LNPSCELVRNWRLASSGMLLCVALVTTDVSEEPSASFIRVTRIGELGTLATDARYEEILLRSVRLLLFTANVVPSSPILVTMMKEALSSSKTSVLTRATRRIQEDAILHGLACIDSQFLKLILYMRSVIWTVASFSGYLFEPSRNVFIRVIFLHLDIIYAQEADLQRYGKTRDQQRGLDGYAATYLAEHSVLQLREKFCAQRHNTPCIWCFRQPEPSDAILYILLHFTWLHGNSREMSTPVETSEDSVVAKPQLWSWTGRGH
jgi:hypothetical protein